MTSLVGFEAFSGFTITKSSGLEAISSLEGDYSFTLLLTMGEEICFFDELDSSFVLSDLDILLAFTENALCLFDFDIKLIT